MRILIMSTFIALMAFNVSADALSNKRNAILNNKETKLKFISQKQQEQKVDLSPFAIDAIGAWRQELRVPTTSNEGIEIIPYQVDKSPS